MAVSSMSAISPTRALSRTGTCATATCADAAISWPRAPSCWATRRAPAGTGSIRCWSPNQGSPVFPASWSACPPDIPVYVGAPDLLNRVAGFHIHRGILAHGSRAAEPDPGALISQLPRPALLVALFGISNHDNLGGIFRNAAAFGADAVLLDNACCDPLYRKAIRVSVGASLMVPFARARDGEALLAVLAASGARAYALATGAAGALHDMRPRSGGMAVLVGSEGRGLPDAALEAADPVRIGMVPGLDSLNAATATGHRASRRSGCDGAHLRRALRLTRCCVRGRRETR